MRRWSVQIYVRNSRHWLTIPRVVVDGTPQGAVAKALRGMRKTLPGRTRVEEIKLVATALAPVRSAAAGAGDE